jgi:translation initiation factor 2 subunit 3
MMAASKSKKTAVQAEVNIGLIGHVDHGKTSLTEALTGKWSDTHSEELKRGISIRLGYADASFYKCGKCKGAEAYATKEECPSCGAAAKFLRKVSFVDAPGHETLMATMLSGAALMQGAVLVIAANEKCPQPRTEEHLAALNISGTKNIVVAQNKIDLVSKEEAMKNRASIDEFLAGYGYKDVPVIPTAATLGLNIDLLIEAIEKHIPTPKQEKGRKMKMYVARSFDINRPGAKPEELKGGVLGGSITEGEISPDDEIEIMPGIDGKPLKTKVYSLAVSEGPIDKAHPGGLVAVSTGLDPNITKNDAMRGQVAANPGSLPEPVLKIKVEIKKLERLINKNPSEIKVNEPLVLAVGTATTLATVSRKEGSSHYELLMKNPVIVKKGEKVVMSRKEETGWRLAAYGIVI